MAAEAAAVTAAAEAAAEEAARLAQQGEEVRAAEEEARLTAPAAVRQQLLSLWPTLLAMLAFVVVSVRHRWLWLPSVPEKNEAELLALRDALREAKVEAQAAKSAALAAKQDFEAASAGGAVLIERAQQEAHAAWDSAERARQELATAMGDSPFVHPLVVLAVLCFVAAVVFVVVVVRWRWQREAARAVLQEQARLAAEQARLAAEQGRRDAEERAQQEEQAKQEAVERSIREMEAAAAAAAAATEEAQSARQVAALVSADAAAEVAATQRRLAQAQAAEANAVARCRRVEIATGPPRHWDCVTASSSAAALVATPPNQGLVRLSAQSDRRVWNVLKSMLKTDGTLLGVGRDVRPSKPYSELQLKSAWRIEQPAAWGWARYRGAGEQVGAEMSQLPSAHKHERGIERVMTRERAAKLPGPLQANVRERVLLHGTTPTSLLSILSNGMNERFSGTRAGAAFGDGLYFAEDAGKCDQYVAPTSRMSDELRQMLYGGPPPPGDLCYLLVCRVVLGQHARTQLLFSQGAVEMDTGRPVFPQNIRRELAAIPGVSPPLHYHSLVVELGRSVTRYREFVLFHSERVYPEYLIAYQRV